MFDDIFTQGDWTGWSQLSFRLVQGAWCLAAFVLVNAYCSTLISYLVSPRLMPVAKTFEDITSGSPQKLKLLAEKNEIVAMHSLVRLPQFLVYLTYLFGKSFLYLYSK